MIEKRESPVQQLITIRDYLRWATSRFNAEQLFFGHGSDNAWDEAVQLVLPSLFLPLDCSPDLLNARLTLEERKCLIDVIELRIASRLPAAYITGKSWFADLEFEVNDSVLVPRSPIGELIQQQFEPWLTAYPHRILDLCTGSGCIGIACAHIFSDAEVVLSDISPAALEVARRNIDKHRFQDQVSVIESDLFSALKGERFELIVTNPPYVNSEDLASMPAEFQAEPVIALGSGDDGLDFTRRLLQQAADHLSEGGVLICEVGNSWPALEAAFPAVPFTWIEFEQGGHGVFLLTARQLQEFTAEFN